MLALLIPLVSGIECQRVILQKDIPCTIYSTWIPNDGCSYPLSIYNQDGDIIQNSTWNTGTPFCNSTFNISTVGTYIYNSSIDDGIIIVEKEDNMLSIILLQIFLIIFFIAIGLPHKAGFVKMLSWGLAVIELLITVWMIYINEIGGSITTLMYTNAISILIIGGTLGFITLFVIMVKLMNVEKNKSIPDDPYTKWMYK